MGLYDRDYAQERWDARGLGVAGWSRTSLLILANVAVFIPMFLSEPTRNWMLKWCALHAAQAAGQGFLWQLLTYNFLHQDFFHIFFNMITLYFFGAVIEDRYGGRRFLLIYLMGGVAGGLAQVAAHQVGLESGGVIGASACVMGIVVLCACLYPRRIVHLLLFFILPIPIPLWVLAAVAVGANLLFFFKGIETGVAYLAHLGGAAWGGVYWLRVERGFGPSVAWPSWLRLRRARRLKRVEPHPRDGPDPNVRAEVDRLLDKISREGIDSLTLAERDYLTRASREFRHRP